MRSFRIARFTLQVMIHCTEVGLGTQVEVVDERKKGFQQAACQPKRFATAPLVHVDLMLEGATGWLWDRDFVKRVEAMCGHKTRLGAREF
jgi:hypothetical protein